MKIRSNKKLLILPVYLMAVALSMVLIPSQSWSGGSKDNDGDGYWTKVAVDEDCDDSNDQINPGAEEVCDGVDNNCDGNIDEGCGGGGDVDTDGDGFLDTTEQAGITLPTGLLLAYSDGTKATQIQPCDGSLPREKCVKWDSPDVFIIVDRTSPSNLALPPYNSTNNPDPLAILRGFTNSAGEPVVPHELTESRSTDRLIADGQHAIRVSEQNDSDLGPLGFAPTGVTPNTDVPGAGEVDLYTERIKDEVNKLCTQVYTFYDRQGNRTDATPDFCQTDGGAVVDMNASSPNLEPLYNDYEANVLAHEAWHAISLAPSVSPDVTLHHYNPNTGFVEEQSIGLEAKMAKDGTVTVTLFISETYHADSKAYYKLN